jgi:NTE family protein
MDSPHALVLGGGGVLGEAWLWAVLAGLDEGEGFASRECGCYVGTSAGSIVAALLSAGVAPHQRLGRDSAVASREPSPVGASALARALGGAAEIAASATAPLASLAIGVTARPGASLRRAALRAVPSGRRSLEELRRIVERTGASWDGRLRIVAVERESGRRVVFGAPDAPAASVAVAVQASCAIPGVFRPVLAAGREYVDGGAWSPTNADVAEVQRGDRVLCLNPTASLRPSRRSLFGAFGPVSRGVAGAEALALRARGAHVSTINPDRDSAAAMGDDLMSTSRRAAVIEAGFAQGMRLGAAGDETRVRGDSTPA